MPRGHVRRYPRLVPGVGARMALHQASLKQDQMSMAHYRAQRESAGRTDELALAQSHWSEPRSPSGGDSSVDAAQLLHLDSTRHRSTAVRPLPRRRRCGARLARARRGGNRDHVPWVAASCGLGRPDRGLVLVVGSDGIVAARLRGRRCGRRPSAQRDGQTNHSVLAAACAAACITARCRMRPASPFRSLCSSRAGIVVQDGRAAPSTRPKPAARSPAPRPRWSPGPAESGGRRSTRHGVP